MGDRWKGHDTGHVDAKFHAKMYHASSRSKYRSTSAVASRDGDLRVRSDHMASAVARAYILGQGFCPQWGSGAKPTHGQGSGDKTLEADEMPD